MRTMEGRKAIEHEDMVTEMIGYQWEDIIDSHISIESWMKFMKPKIEQYLEKHELPKDPKYGKHKEQ